MNRIIAIIFLFISLLLLSPRNICGQVLINEFSSNSNPEWIELYNTGAENVDLTGWKITDSSGNTENISGSIMANGFFVYEKNQVWLNNSGGDVIILKNVADGIVNSIIYGHVGDNAGTPDADKSTGRIPNASEIWQTNLVWTKGTNNPESVSTPSPTPTATISKATYKINKPKDDTGTEISSVQIYVDGEYIHHEDDELLEFYSGHECYSGINCSLGIHTISLRKIGYSNWGETKDFQAGTNLEVDPVLFKQNTASPTPLPTKTPTPVPTPTKTPTPKPTPSPDVLGEASSSGIIESVFGLDNSPNPTPDINTNGVGGKFPFIAIIFVVSGIILVGTAGYMAYRKQKQGSPDILNE